MKLSAKMLFFLSSLLGVFLPTLVYLIVGALSGRWGTETLELVYRWVDLIMMTSGWTALVFFALGIFYWKA